MAILGVDLTFPEGSVAVVESGSVLSIVSWGNSKMHAELVFAEIDRCLKVAGLGLGEIEKVVVTSGPGSFTGVRLSVTVGKSFQVGGLPVFSISTLKAVTVGFDLDSIAVVIPARRNRFYTLVDGEEGDFTVEEVIRKVEGKIVVYRNELPKEFLSFPSIRDMTPLALKAALAPENFLEPLRFHYIRNHDAKKPQDLPR